MRFAFHALLFALALAPAAGAQTGDATADVRSRVIDTLEKLLATGEPQHNTHDEGEWLQRQVDAAFARGDEEIEQLARRAAVPLVAYVPRPVSRTSWGPGLAVLTPKALTVQKPAEYTAEMFASLDGGPLVHFGTVPSSGPRKIDRAVVESWNAPGLHHLRIRAHVTFDEESGLPPEIRDLPELVFATYDAESSHRHDARVFLTNAANVSAMRLDAALPDVPLRRWLSDVVAPYGATVDPDNEWPTANCDERTVEAGLPPRTRDICVIGYFQVKTTIGEVWIRTGRVELAENEVRWLAEGPRFEALRLRYNGSSEIDRLSRLPELLERPHDTHPAGDLSIAPEDIVATRSGRTVRVSAIVRNNGTAIIRNASVVVTAVTAPEERVEYRSFVVDVPMGGTAEIAATFPFNATYGLVLVHGMQISEHSPHDAWMEDPTPYDTVAFRIVNPKGAPKNFLQRILGQCGPPCRGY